MNESESGDTMTELDAHGGDRTWWQPGDHIEAWEQQVLRYTGTVETSAPELGVVWIIESGIGLRKMLSVHQYRLCSKAIEDH